MSLECQLGRSNRSLFALHGAWRNLHRMLSFQHHHQRGLEMQRRYHIHCRSTRPCARRFPLFQQSILRKFRFPSCSCYTFISPFLLGCIESIKPTLRDFGSPKNCPCPPYSHLLHVIVDELGFNTFGNKSQYWQTRTKHVYFYDPPLIHHSTVFKQQNYRQKCVE